MTEQTEVGNQNYLYVRQVYIGIERPWLLKKNLKLLLRVALDEKMKKANSIELITVTNYGGTGMQKFFRNLNSIIAYLVMTSNLGSEKIKII